MSSPALYRRPARGRPALGFQLDIPSEVELREASGLACREVRPDGRVAGELEASVFAAALIIDRDGILAEKARAVVRREVPGRAGEHAEAVAVRLPGANGYRAEAVHAGPLPYVFVFAIAPNDLGVDGGVLITVRSARPDWASADHMLRSLRILKRNGTVDGSTAAEPDDAGRGELMLPVVASHG